MTDKEIIEGLYDAKRTIANAPIMVSENTELQAALDAAISRLQSLQWRPIEEAPKDGTEFYGLTLARYEYSDVCDVTGYIKNGGCVDAKTDEPIEPTHFIPLSAFNQEEE